MQSRVSLIAVVVLTLASGACVRISTTRVAPAGRSVSTDSVRVFATQSPGEYTELAVLRAHRFLARDSQVLDALRKQAAQLGANGLLLLNTRGSGGVRGTGTGVVVGGPRGSITRTKLGVGVASARSLTACRSRRTHSTTRLTTGALGDSTG